MQKLSENQKVLEIHSQNKKKYVVCTTLGIWKYKRISNSKRRRKK